jgi:cytochrome c biogenesis protein CcmG, thiol:disulfide interchange protein DsbE
MTTTPHEDVFQPEPATPLGPARGRLTLVFLAVIALGLIVARGLAPPADDAAVQGPLSGPAPEVVLSTFDGGEWRLSTHLADDGRPVVLNLWASWCIPCREEIPELSSFATDNPNVAVVGVAVNDREASAQALADELQPAYLVGLDATGRLRDRYPSVGMPFTVVIDGQGMIRWSKAGGVTADELASATAGVG